MGNIFYLGFISKYLIVCNALCLLRNIHFLSIYMAALREHYGMNKSDEKIQPQVYQKS